MRRPRRNSVLEPRLELTPLIDVVFLLLTFFVVAMTLLVRAEVMPVRFAAVEGGQEAEPGVHRLDVLAVDADGRVTLNAEPVARERLDAELAAFAEQSPDGVLYLLLELDGRVDRGPLLFDLLQRIQRAGITRPTLVEPTVGGLGGGA